MIHMLSGFLAVLLAGSVDHSGVFPFDGVVVCPGMFGHD